MCKRLVILIVAWLAPFLSKAQTIAEIRNDLDSVKIYLDKIDDKKVELTTALNFLKKEVALEKASIKPIANGASRMELLHAGAELSKVAASIRKHETLRNADDFKRVNRKYLIILKNLDALISTLNAGNYGSNAAMSYTFFYYDGSKGRPGNLSFKTSDEWYKVREKYGMKKIEEIVSGNVHKLSLECNQLDQFGICLNGGRYNELQIQSILKTVLPDDQYPGQYKSYVTREINSTDNIVFVDLYSVLKNAYVEKSRGNKEELCCPDDPAMSEDELLRAKLCGASAVDKGLEVILQNKHEAKRIVITTNGPAIKTGRFYKGEFPNIEPRSYVTIYEKKRPTSKATAVWYLTKRYEEIDKDKTDHVKNEKSVKYFGDQVFSIVDAESILEVRFDQESLADNIDFYGNISLVARAGNNKIEVSPYSVIGKPQKTYGVNSKPIREIADYILKLRTEAVKACSLIKGIEVSIANHRTNLSFRNNDVESFNIAKTEFFNSLKGRVEKQNNVQVNEASEDIPLYFFKLDEVSSQLEKLEKEPTVNDRSIISSIRQRGKVTYTYFKGILNTIYNDTAETASAKAISKYLEDRINALIAKINSARSAKDYIIPESEYPIIEAYAKRISSQLIPEDRTKLENALAERIVKPEFVNGLKRAEKGDILTTNLPNWEMFLSQSHRILKYMEYIDQSGDESKEAFLQLILMTKIDFNETYRAVREAVQYYESSKLLDQRITSLTEPQFYTHFFRLSSAIKEINTSSPELMKYLKESGYDENFRKDSLKDAPLAFLQDAAAYNQVRDRVALFAGKMIFSKLVYATIDLKKEGVREGDYVYVSVMWYNINGGSQAADDGIELAAAKFYVKETGWRFSATESVFLIDRINEDYAPVDNLSPSNFKPTAGASMLWTYRSNKRLSGIKVLSYLGNLIEPSFGINVSYLDFNTQKDFEIGMGLVAGLFDNKIFFTYGYNLSVRQQSPYYFGVGFSFFNVLNTIRSKAVN